MDLLKKISGCEEVIDGDVRECMVQDENCELLENGEIVVLMKEENEPHMKIFIKFHNIL